jgi:N-acyl-D-amino-acid deacylase
MAEEPEKHGENGVREETSMEHEILIKNGTIYDGTGRKPFLGDVLIGDGKIAEVDARIEAAARTVIDARGLAVSPGFIDPHTHCDFTFIHDKGNVSNLMQGVTTAIVGLCGLGAIPMKKSDMPGMLKLYAGIFGLGALCDFDFENTDEYLAAATGARINAAAAAAHCNMRICCGGYSDFAYGGKIAEAMRAVLREQFAMGAVGFSTGLDYYPAKLCGTDELIDLCKVTKECGGVFMIHMRPFIEGRLSHIPEAIAIAKESGVKTHILHIKTFHPFTSGHPEMIVGPVEKANAEGADITMEFYPYHAFASYALAFLPSWALDGDYEKVMSILSDKAVRKELSEHANLGYEAFMYGLTPARVMSAGNHPEYEGRTFDEIAAERDQSIGEMIVDVLYESKLQFLMASNEPQDEKVRETLENDFMELFKNPIYTVGSDAIMAGSMPHPRAYGSIAKMFRLSRKHGVPIETTVHKLTAFVADRFSLKDRGRLTKGGAADIAVFDPENFSDQATYENPKALAEGMRHVAVNGKLALYDGKETDGRHGTALKPRL